jgi:hypothetical protein
MGVGAWSYFIQFPVNPQFNRSMSRTANTNFLMISDIRSKLTNIMDKDTWDPVDKVVKPPNNCRKGDLSTHHKTFDKPINEMTPDEYPIPSDLGKQELPKH